MGSQNSGGAKDLLYLLHGGKEKWGRNLEVENEEKSGIYNY